MIKFQWNFIGIQTFKCRLRNGVHFVSAAMRWACPSLAECESMPVVNSSHAHIRNGLSALTANVWVEWKCNHVNEQNNRKLSWNELWFNGKVVSWFYRNSNIFIQENALENVVCEMASILSRPQCVELVHHWPSASPCRLLIQATPIFAMVYPHSLQTCESNENVIT